MKNGPPPSERKIISCGLIAGLRMAEMRRMTPGFIMDMFVYRAKYDQPMMMAKMFGARK